MGTFKQETFQMACTSSAECAEITDGCCFGWTVNSFPEDGFWGDFEALWAETEYYPEVGYTYTACDSAAGAEASSGDMSLYDAMAAGFAVATEDELAELGLYGDESMDDIIGFGGSDAYTFESTMGSGACVDGAEDAATTLIAGATAVMAVAIL